MILTALLLAAAQPAAATPAAVEPPRELSEAWLTCYGENATRLIRANSDEAAAADEAGRLCRPQQQALIAWAGRQEPRATSRETLGNIVFLFFYMREMAVSNANLIRNPLPDAADILAPDPPTGD